MPQFYSIFYIPNISVVCLRSCQSDSGSSSKEKWINTTGESYLRQLLLLDTGPGYVGCSAPSQGVFTLCSVYINTERVFASHLISLQLVTKMTSVISYQFITAATAQEIKLH